MKLYAGAGGLLAPEEGCALPPERWGWQAKLDGLYAHAYTDERGVVTRVHSRTGGILGAATSLVGCALGIPDAVIAGEYEAGTEAGRRAAETRGWGAFHMFDCIALSGRSVASHAALTRHRLLEHALGFVEGESSWWVDAFGAAHDPFTGRYVRPVPRDARRFPLVRLHTGAGSGAELWRAYVEIGGGEGAVAIDLRAPIGKRGAKRKIKTTDTIDCVVVSVDARAAVVAWRDHRFVVSTQGETCLHPGEVVEVAHNGFYEHAVKGAPIVPRFARLVRTRRDKHAGDTEH